MKNTSHRKAFTLIELILVAGIFGVVILVASTSMININRAHRRLVLEDYVNVEARHLMQRVAREVYQNTVDYEEYFNMVANSGTKYGDDYGEYAMGFYDWGTNGEGCECTNPPAVPPDPPITCPDHPDCIINRFTVDTVTGENGVGTAFDNGGVFQTVSELYLIDATGRTKTLIVKEEDSLAMVRMLGTDSDNDSDIDTWACDLDVYSCPTGDVPNPDDKSNGIDDVDFVPITPSNIRVVDFKLVITPQDDPHKAFSEADLAHPKVTILLTVEPTDSARAEFHAETVKPLTLQATYSSQVRNEVVSYRQ